MPYDGVDVDFVLVLADGEIVEGEVTLLPHEDGTLGLASWGSADHWVSGAALARLRRLDDGDFRDALARIAAAWALRVMRPHNPVTLLVLGFVLGLLVAGVVARAHADQADDIRSISRSVERIASATEKLAGRCK